MCATSVAVFEILHVPLPTRYSSRVCLGPVLGTECHQLEMIDCLGYLFAVSVPVY
jgi:hypothetical protein